MKSVVINGLPLRIEHQRMGMTTRGRSSTHDDDDAMLVSCAFTQRRG